MIPVRSQWGRYNLPRPILVRIHFGPTFGRISSQSLFSRQKGPAKEQPMVGPKNPEANPV